MTVHIKRHIAKTITYRLLGTLVTCVVSFIFIGDIKISAMLGIAELTVKPITYFLHERVWYKWIKFGINKTEE
jgi:uncharacterized membrane protein